MVGQTFGEWTVISDEIIKDKNNKKAFLVRCKCTKEKYVLCSILKCGRSKSCANCAVTKNKKYDPVNYKELIGKEFFNWIVIDAPIRIDNKPEIYIKCICKCRKTEKSIRYFDLFLGKSKQCKSCSTTKRNTKHGLRFHKLYRVWNSMKERCRNPNDKHYKDYGGRGIKVCDRWISCFKNFLDDMGERPNGYQIDRTNNDGNYEPDNCRWVTPKENHANRRCSKKNKPNNFAQDLKASLKEAILHQQGKIELISEEYIQIKDNND